MPYDPTASILEQVKALVELLLKHLKPTDGGSSSADDSSYIDTVVLHSPLATIDDTMEAWRALEEYVPERIRNLGVSNCNLFTLMDICEWATIKPASDTEPLLPTHTVRHGNLTVLPGKFHPLLELLDPNGQPRTVVFYGGWPVGQPLEN